MNLNKKILALVITTCVLNITSSSYCMRTNKTVIEIKENKLGNYKNIL